MAFMNKRKKNEYTSLGAKSEHYDLRLKFLVVGEEGVGKKSLILRHTNDSYLPSFIGTLGDNYNRKVKVDNYVVMQQIWPGKPIRRFNQKSTRGVDVIILAFDLTNEDSFNKLPAYLKHITENTGSNVELVLAGTKCDDVANRKVSEEAIAQFTEQHNIPYVETSAKEAKRVSHVFDTGTRLVLDRLKQQSLLEAMLDPDKNKLITDLQKYISRIEKHMVSENSTPDFSHGFLFFKKSRALNRQANYLLAKNLLENLQDPDQTIQDVFTDVDKQRNDIISKNSFWTSPNYANRGMNSTELQSIIDDAQKIIDGEQKISNPQS